MNGNIIYSTENTENSNLQFNIVNSSEVIRDTTPPTISEQSILNEINDISSKISCKKTFNLGSLGKYAQILKTLEENRDKFIQVNSIDLNPLTSFAQSSQQLTVYIQSLIERFNNLSNINNSLVMNDIYANIEKINQFVNTSETLFTMMEQPEQFEWFNKYNNTFGSIKKSIDAYEKISKQIAHQLEDPVNYVNPQIKNLTDLFNNINSLTQPNSLLSSTPIISVPSMPGTSAFTSAFPPMSNTCTETGTSSQTQDVNTFQQFPPTSVSDILISPYYYWIIILIIVLLIIIVIGIFVMIYLYINKIRN